MLCLNRTFKGSNNVSVIDTATNEVTSTVPVGKWPYGVSVTPDGTKVYVANAGNNTTSIIGTATDSIIASPVIVGNRPIAFGQFMEPDNVSSQSTEAGETDGQNTSPTISGGFNFLVFISMIVLYICTGKR